MKNSGLTIFSGFSAGLADVEAGGRRKLCELEKQGIVQGFEFTHELGWNILKDTLEEQGVSGIIGGEERGAGCFQKRPD